MAQEKPKGTSNRGFASMDEAKQREIASKGGRSVAPQDRSFSQNRKLAAEAGRKGGQASHGGNRAKNGSNRQSVEHLPVEPSSGPTAGQGPAQLQNSPGG